MTLSVGAALIPGTVHAASITSEFGLPIIESLTEIKESGNLNKFNPSLGTLTGATLTVFMSATQKFSITNTSAQDQFAKISSTVNLFWNSSLPSNPLPGTVLNFEASTGFVNYAVGETIEFGPFASTDMASLDLGGILSELIGPGQFSVDFKSLSGLSTTGGGGNLRTKQVTTAGGGARIEYTFDDAPTPAPVPEPSTFLLLGSGLAGVIGWKYRKKQI